MDGKFYWDEKHNVTKLEENEEKKSESSVRSTLPCRLKKGNREEWFQGRSESLGWKTLFKSMSNFIIKHNCIQHTDTETHTCMRTLTFCFRIQATNFRSLFWLKGAACPLRGVILKSQWLMVIKRGHKIKKIKKFQVRRTLRTKQIVKNTFKV